MLTRFTIIGLLHTFAYLPLFAGEPVSEDPARHIASFSFRQFSGGIILLKATLNNHPDSLNFVLDTGCGGISIDSVTCDLLKLQVSTSNVTIRGIAGARKVSFANNNTLNLPGLRVDSLNFHINDYEILTNVYGEHIDGIIGQSFFSRYIVKVNYDSNRIHVYTPGTIKYPRGGHILKPNWRSIPIESGHLEENFPVDARFYLDIGAGMCLVLSHAFAEDSISFAGNKKMYETQAEGIGGKARMKITTVREFKLGPYRFKKVPVYIFEDLYNVTEYPHLGGLIGNDLLRRFNAIFNYQKKEIHLLPNKHYTERFDYSYTGLGFYFYDNAVRVTDIMGSSPAEKAGFKVGDIIIGMDNIIGADIQSYKTILMAAGKTIKVIVMRNGQLVELKLKIVSILKGKLKNPPIF